MASSFRRRLPRRSRAPPMREETPDEPLWESERLFSDAVGRLIEFWGFKRNLGRIWGLLYLHGAPLTSVQLQSRLQMSSGAVSMTVQELARWGVIKKTWMPGERRDYYEAEIEFWKMISRVFRERERVEVALAIDAMEEALDYAERKEMGTKNGAERDKARHQIGRIRHLLDLARVGLRLIDMLVDKGRVDASPLFGLLLGSAKPKDV